MLFRPIDVIDGGKMTDLFYALSEETIYKRWMSAMVSMHHQQLQRYLDVDDTDNIAIVVEARQDRREPEIVGVGRYHRNKATNYADVAFVLRDDWQSKGVGTALLRHLVDVARENGVRGFTADVLATNTTMIRVFHKLGLPVRSELEGSVYSLTIPFTA